MTCFKRVVEQRVMLKSVQTSMLSLNHVAIHIIDCPDGEGNLTSLVVWGCVKVQCKADEVKNAFTQ